MASMKLGSKSESFQRDGDTWQCTTGLPSDVTIEIGEMFFYLHKFPLLSRSGRLEKLIGETPGDDGTVRVLHLRDIPGGAKAFELIAKFCYGVKMELTALNVVGLRCAAEFLQMTEDYGELNLISQTEIFLDEVFTNWTDTIKALGTCEEVLPFSEDLHLVSRCIKSLAIKACSDLTLFNWPVNNKDNSSKGILWNGISTVTNQQPVGDDWWYEDVSYLSLPFYKRLIKAVELGGMKSESIAGSIVVYAKKYIPVMNRCSSFKDKSHTKIGALISTPSEADQRALLEEIVELLPTQKGIIQTKFLLRLLRTAMILQASPSCRENMEKRIGSQLDQASLEDLLIPNMGYTVETLYDIDCFQRILDHFMGMEMIVSASCSPCIVEEGQILEDENSLSLITNVASLVDSYLADVASDVNLKFQKFLSLAAAVPDYARPLADGIYRAIDIYLKAHPWLTDTEREQICRLMNCQKLSLEASTHAAQNERLPLRVIVQVLFFEQLRLRTSISGWFFVSDNLDNSQTRHTDHATTNNSSSLSKNDGEGDVPAGADDVRDRVCELEKECHNMKEDIHKLVKAKRGWNIFCRRRSHQCNSKPSKPCTNGKLPPIQSINARNNKNKDEGCCIL